MKIVLLCWSIFLYTVVNAFPAAMHIQSIIFIPREKNNIYLKTAAVDLSDLPRWCQIEQSNFNTYENFKYGGWIGCSFGYQTMMGLIKKYKLGNDDKTLDDYEIYFSARCGSWYPEITGGHFGGGFIKPNNFRIIFTYDKDLKSALASIKLLPNKKHCFFMAYQFDKNNIFALGGISKEGAQCDAP